MNSARQFLIELIQNEYDPAPSHFNAGDEWDDGSGRIADQIISRFNPPTLEQIAFIIRQKKQGFNIPQDLALEMADAILALWGKP